MAYEYKAVALWDTHREIARLLTTGLKDVEIAQLTGFTTATIRNLRGNPLFQEHVETLQDGKDEDAVNISQRIKQLQGKALGVLDQIISETDEDDNFKHSPTLRAKIAEGLLAKGGHGNIQKVKGEHSHAHLTVADIDKINERADKLREEQESKWTEAEIIDTETTTVMVNPGTEIETRE